MGGDAARKPFNLTIVECKRLPQRLRMPPTFAFNLTIVECKPTLVCIRTPPKGTFNLTIVECKLHPSGDL